MTQPSHHSGKIDPRYEFPAVIVQDTAMGKGLFAAKTFQFDEIIGEIVGDIYTDPDYGSPYSMDLGGDLTLEPEAPFRFLNHSCEPNAELFEWDYEDEPRPQPDRLWIHALGTIQAGDEITIDYEWPSDAAIKCLCGAATCRGWVVDKAELHLVEKPAATNAGV